MHFHPEGKATSLEDSFLSALQEHMPMQRGRVIPCFFLRGNRLVHASGMVTVGEPRGGNLSGLLDPRVFSPPARPGVFQKRAVRIAPDHVLRNERTGWSCPCQRWLVFRRMLPTGMFPPTLLPASVTLPRSAISAPSCRAATWRAKAFSGCLALSCDGRRQSCCHAPARWWVPAEGVQHHQSHGVLRSASADQEDENGASVELLALCQG